MLKLTIRQRNLHLDDPDAYSMNLCMLPVFSWALWVYRIVSSIRSCSVIYMPRKDLLIGISILYIGVCHGRENKVQHCRLWQQMSAAA